MEKKRLLIADCSADFLEELKVACEKAGYAADAVCSVEDAKTLLIEGRYFDAALLGVHLDAKDLEKENGEIRASDLIAVALYHRRVPTIRVVDGKQQLHSAYAQGGRYAPQEVLQKPLAFEDLEQVIAQAIRNFGPE